MNDDCDPVWHEREGGCYRCCDQCNYDTHTCPGCGENLMHNGYEVGNHPHPDCT